MSTSCRLALLVTEGTLRTHGPLFVVLLLGAVVLTGALTSVPALAPVAEHLSMSTVSRKPPATGINREKVYIFYSGTQNAAGPPAQRAL